jgi:hypothetical protein
MRASQRLNISTNCQKWPQSSRKFAGTVRQESRTLNMQMEEQRRLNSKAIKAKLTGELNPEDFEAFKESITEEAAKIEAVLSTLESERQTIEELSRQSKLEDISLVNTWREPLSKARSSCKRHCFHADCTGTTKMAF